MTRPGDDVPPLPSAEAIYAALVALGKAPVGDPQLRPDGPLPEDAPSLLGALAAAVDAATMSLLVGGTAARDEWAAGYIGQGDDDPGQVMQMQAARLSESARLLGGHVSSTPPVASAAKAAQVATHQLMAVALMATAPAEGVDPLTAEEMAPQLRELSRRVVTDLQAARRHHEEYRRLLREGGVSGA